MAQLDLKLFRQKLVSGQSQGSIPIDVSADVGTQVSPSTANAVLAVNSGATDWIELLLTQANLGTVLAGLLQTGTAAPTTGAHLRGEIVWNTTPSSGGPPGWSCVTAGTPGTWKAMANLA